MTWDLSKVETLENKVAIVTGANIGLGYETALELAKLNAKVILACRNKQKAQDAKDKIKAAYANADVDVLLVDLSDLASVEKFANKVLENYQSLDLLINNAGIMMPPREISVDGFEMQMAANYFGHFKLTHLLLPILEKTPGARIVSLSSMAHRWGNIQFDDITFSKKYSKRKSYGQSKVACLMFAYYLSEHLKTTGSKVLSMAAHPGVSATNLTKYMPKGAAKLTELLFQPANMGALPTLYAALNPELSGGEYIGPKGFNEMGGQPKIVSSNKYSKNVELQEKLWNLSKELTHVS